MVLLISGAAAAACLFALLRRDGLAQQESRSTVARSSWIDGEGARGVVRPAFLGEQSPRAGTERPTPAVRDAIRDLLSRDAIREQRAERMLLKAGVSIVPQLRYWLERVRHDEDRVQKLLEELLAVSGHADDARPFPRDLRVADFFSRKLLEAKKLAQRGEYRRARAFAEALLTLDDDSPIAWELRRVAREARERVIASRLEPRLDAGRTVYRLGETPDVVFRLVNRSKQTARIELVEGVIGTIDATVDQRSIDGSHSSKTRKLALRSTRDVSEIVLKPGEIWVQEVSLSGITGATALTGQVARLRVEGEFRPFRWRFDGNEEDNLRIGVVPVECWFVPPSQIKGLASPLERLVSSIVLGGSEEFLVGGQLSVWAGRRDPVINEKLVEALIEHLDALDTKRRRLAGVFLAEATGKRYRSVADWRQWWAQRRPGAAPDDAPEESEPQDSEPR